MTLSLCIWLGEKSPPGTNTSTSVIRWMQSPEVRGLYVSVASRRSVAFSPKTGHCRSSSPSVMRPGRILLILKSDGVSRTAGLANSDRCRPPQANLVNCSGLAPITKPAARFAEVVFSMDSTYIMSAGELEAHPGRTDRIWITGNSSTIGLR